MRIRPLASAVAIVWFLAPLSSLAQDWEFFVYSAEDYRKNERHTNDGSQGSSPRDVRSTPGNAIPVAPTMQDTINKPRRPINERSPDEIRAYQRRLQSVMPEFMERLRNRSDTLLEDSKRRTLESQRAITPPNRYWTPQSRDEFKAKPRTFYWGVKESGYEYSDYEFQYDISDMRQVEAYTEAITEMSRAGWTIGLNRTKQRITETSEGRSVLTTHEVRFRRKSR